MRIGRFLLPLIAVLTSFIALPLPALASILHRASGVFLFAGVAVLLYLLDLSLRDADGFSRATAWLQSTGFRLGSAIIAWSLFHHLFSGVRYLLIDIEAGVGLRQARASAWLVNIAGVAATLLYLGWVL